MDKQALLEETYNSAFEDELEKIAMSPKLLRSYTRKKAVQNAHNLNKMNKAFDAKSGIKYSKGYERESIAKSINKSRKHINKMKGYGSDFKHEARLAASHGRVLKDGIKQARS